MAHADTLASDGDVVDEVRRLRPAGALQTYPGVPYSGTRLLLLQNIQHGSEAGMADRMTLGSRVEDLVDGRKGVVTGRAEYLYASPAVLVSSEEKHNESWWIDEARVSQLPQRQHHEAGFTPPGK